MKTTVNKDFMSWLVVAVLLIVGSKIMLDISLIWANTVFSFSSLLVIEQKATNLIYTHHGNK